MYGCSHAWDQSTLTASETHRPYLPIEWQGKCGGIQRSNPYLYSIPRYCTAHDHFIIVIAQPASQSSPRFRSIQCLCTFQSVFELRISVCKFLNSLIMHAENRYTAWCAQNSVRIQSVESDSANGSIYCINKQYFYFARSLVTCIALTLGNAPK